MAHWAEIDKKNIVKRVIVTDNSADDGYEWIVENLGGTWVKTSYNTFGGHHNLGGIPFRKNYASPGMIYDKIRDAFYEPQPYPSWVLNESTCLWEAPTPRPSLLHAWDEESVSWVERSRD